MPRSNGVVSLADVANYCEKQEEARNPATPKSSDLSTTSSSHGNRTRSRAEGAKGKHADSLQSLSNKYRLRSESCNGYAAKMRTKLLQREADVAAGVGRNAGSFFSPGKVCRHQPIMTRSLPRNQTRKGPSTSAKISVSFTLLLILNPLSTLSYCEKRQFKKVLVTVEPNTFNPVFAKTPL